MPETKAAWDNVAKQFDGLGLKLKYHFEQARKPSEYVEPIDTAHADAAEDDRVHAALRRLGDALDDAFDAVGAAAKDPAVRADVRRVGGSLTEALSSTFAEINDDLRRAFRRDRD